MNRIQFIAKALLGIAGISIVKDLFTSQTSQLNIDANDVKLLSCNIAGFQYYDGLDVEKKIRQNDSLRLVHEQDNAYDKNAVAVYWKHYKLGFIPKYKNEIIANLIRSGKSVSAISRHINPSQSPWYRMWIRVVLK